MKSLSANEAKTHFGDLLLMVQREPVQVKKNGKAVAVMVSVDDYMVLEELKLQQLASRIKQAKKDIDTNNFIEGDEFFDDLLNRKWDEKK